MINLDCRDDHVDRLQDRPRLFFFISRWLIIPPHLTVAYNVLYFKCLQIVARSDRITCPVRHLSEQANSSCHKCIHDELKRPAGLYLPSPAVTIQAWPYVSNNKPAKLDAIHHHQGNALEAIESTSSYHTAPTRLFPRSPPQYPPAHSKATYPSGCLSSRDPSTSPDPLLGAYLHARPAHSPSGPWRTQEE